MYFHRNDIVMFKAKKYNFFEKIFRANKKHYAYSIDDKLIKYELKKWRYM